MKSIVNILIAAGITSVFIFFSGCSSNAALAPEAPSPAPGTPTAAPAPTTPAPTAANASVPVVLQVPVTLSFVSSQPASVSIVRNNTANLKINAIYTGTGTAAGKSQDVTNSATYLSSNPAIATVTAGGQVTGIAAGSATITVTFVDGTITKTCTVAVTVT